MACTADRDAIIAAAGLTSVGEVWFDYEPPLAAVEDGGGQELPIPEVYGPPAPPWSVPGNGPIATRGDKVWNLGFQGKGVVIMNSDSGINTSHLDLASRLWKNPGEIPGNGIDDDNNGFIDDVYGWNFGSNNNSISDSGGHGTRTAGCMVADGTCNGTVYGQAPAARVMTGRLSGESSQWAAIQYAIKMGADVQTSSHSYKLHFNQPPNYKMHRDVGENSLAAGLIRTNSTSNAGSSCNSSSSAQRKPFNISAPGCLPAPYLDPNQTLVGRLGGVIGVAAWDWQSDNLKSYSPCGPFAWFFNDILVNRSTYPSSNWDHTNDNDYPWQGGSQQGLLKPDIASPTDTRTTASGTCGFTTFSGTSNATPNVAGVYALWKSANPSLTPEDVAMVLHQTARDRGGVPGKENNWGAGVVDARAGVLRALAVQRVDGQPAWDITHSVVSGSAALTVDGVPNTIVVLAVGFIRQDVNLGPVISGIGGTFDVLRFAVTDAQGDFTHKVAVPGSAVGVHAFVQSFQWDIGGVTGSILPSNVVGVTIVP